MSLKQVLEPFSPAPYSRAQHLCRKHLAAGTYNIRANGVIDVEGSVDLNKFVEHGKLAVQFGSIKTTNVLRLDSVRTLQGLPKSMLGTLLYVSSGFLESLEGGPETAGVMHVTAHFLKSLKGAPKTADSFTVVSSGLPSLVNVPTIVGALNLLDCPSVKTTDGLKGVTTVDLHLPLSGSLKITELPNSCNALTVAACTGFGHLFRIPDLDVVHLGEHYPKPIKAKLEAVIKETLALPYDKPRIRWLHADRLLIEKDLEHLL